MVRPKGPIMTRQRDFKSLVRERMAKTGERYTTARTHLLARTIRHSQPAKAFPGILSGYDTSPQGELLVSTFTAGMHPHEPMSGHILPVIMSWHMGIELVHLAGSSTGQLDPEKFWCA